MLNKLTIPELTCKQLCNFWKKVKKCKPNECWPWLAGCDRKGYGQLWLGIRQYKASRVSLAIAGKRNDILEVCHSCNNPNCVNPQHLRFGTHSENEQDKALVGRDPKGSRSGMAKLTETDIPIIRKLRETTTCQEIGSLFGVTKNLISQIIRGKIWKHVVGIATDKEVKQYLRELK